MSSIWEVRRSVTDAKLGGVCGGVADQWGVDPVLVRVGAALLALSGGIGVVLYLAAWLLIPAADSDRAHLDDIYPQARRWPRAVKVLIVVVACVVAASLTAPVLPFGFGSALVLAAIWYFGYYKNRGARHSEGASPGAASGTGPDSGRQLADARPPEYDYFTFTGQRTAFTQAAQAWQDRMREHQRASMPAPPGTVSGRPAADLRAEAADRRAFLSTPDPVGLYAPTAAAPVFGSSRSAGAADSGTGLSVRGTKRALSRPARRLRLVAVLVLGLTMTGLGLASARGVHVGLTTYLAAALLVAGLTLVAAAWVGRARGILPIAVLLALATSASALGGTATGAAGSPDVGVQQISYRTSSAMPTSKELGSGSLTVDLGDLKVSGNRGFNAHVGQGSLTIIAPPQTRVVIDAAVTDGYLKIDGDKGRWGSDLTANVPYAGPDPSGPVVLVHATVDQGLLEVER